MVPETASAMQKERRKHARYSIENAVVISPDGIYQVIDISEGGFRFKCNPLTAVPETWLSDILNSVIPLDELLTKKIWISVNENFNVPSLMFVGAKFNDLKEEQKLKLTKLLQSISAEQM